MEAPLAGEVQLIAPKIKYLKITIIKGLPSPSLKWA
jgi:hypothetical protein